MKKSNEMFQLQYGETHDYDLRPKRETGSCNGCGDRGHQLKNCPVKKPKETMLVDGIVEAHAETVRRDF